MVDSGIICQPLFLAKFPKRLQLTKIQVPSYARQLITVAKQNKQIEVYFDFELSRQFSDTLNQNKNTPLAATKVINFNFNQFMKNLLNGTKNYFQDFGILYFHRCIKGNEVYLFYTYHVSQVPFCKNNSKTDMPH